MESAAGPGTEVVPASGLARSLPAIHTAPPPTASARSTSPATRPIRRGRSIADRSEATSSIQAVPSRGRNSRFGESAPSSPRNPGHISRSTIAAAYTSARASISVSPGLLRRHVGRRSRPLRLRTSEQVGQTEVEELHPTVLTEEDVGGLEVPVQDAPLVRVREPLRHLAGDAQGLVLGNGTVGDPLGERPPAQQLHHEVRARVARAHVEERDDAGMIEPRDRLGLPLQPFGGEVLPLPGEPEGLHGHDPVQLGIDGRVDGSEASPADLMPDLEPADPIAGGEFLPPGLQVLAPGGVRQFLEQPGQRAGAAGAHSTDAVALLVIPRQAVPPGWRGSRLAGASRHCHPGLPAAPFPQ